MLLAAVTLWALNISASRYMLTHGLEPLAYASVRYAVAAVSFAVITLATEQSLRLDGRDRLLALGAAGAIALNQISFVYAVRLTSATVVALVLAATPILVATAGVVLGIDRVPLRFWGGALVSLAGVGVVALATGGAIAGDAWGVLLGVLAAATWGAYSMLVAPLMKRASATRISAIVLGLGCIPLLLVSSPQLAAQDWSLPPRIWLLLGFATFGVLVLTSFLWFHSLDRIGPARATLSTNLRRSSRPCSPSSCWESRSTHSSSRVVC